VIGVFRLGVALDWGLLLGSATLAATMAPAVRAWRSVRANRIERSGRLPGDDFISEPLGTLTHAITLRDAPQDVWPWLIQMGAGNRGGWYCYDSLDNAWCPRLQIARSPAVGLQAARSARAFPDAAEAAAGDCSKSRISGRDHGRRCSAREAERMNANPRIRLVAGVLAAGAGIAAGAYGAYAAITWYRYGCTPQPDEHERDDLLDRFIPAYEVVERHHLRVAAPAAVTLAAAREQDLLRLPLVGAIIKAREIVLRATPDDRPQPRGLVAAVQALGWGILAEIPDRELVVGAVTKPWEPNVTFRALPPDEFAEFSEPGFIKIAWTLRADPADDGTSIFRTETRAIATDATGRARFRRYWAFASPGIALIRRLSLRPLKHEAERRAQMAEPGSRANTAGRVPCPSPH
jgi:hypothetical protein